MPLNPSEELETDEVSPDAERFAFFDEEDYDFYDPNNVAEYYYA